LTGQSEKEKGGKMKMLTKLKNPKIAFIFASFLILGFCYVQTTFGKQLFADDFEKDEIDKEPSKWKVVDKVPGDPPGQVIKEPNNPRNKVLVPSKRGDRIGRIYVVGEPDWKDFIAEWDWIYVIDNCIGMVFRYKDRDNHYLFDRRAGWANKDQLHFYKRENGGWANFGQTPVDAKLNQLNKWYRVQLKVEKDTFSIKLKERDDKTDFSDLKILLTATDATFKSGYFGVYAGEDPASCYYDNVVVGETEADLTFAVRLASKIATTWGSIKK
jgi:hypothetical protein